MYAIRSYYASPLPLLSLIYLAKACSISLQWLLWPALLALTILVFARLNYPKTEHLEVKNGTILTVSSKKFYWIYLAAVSLIAAGFADYPLIAFHFNKTGQVTTEWIPVMYAVAMGVDALAALLLGRLFDKHGIKVLIGSTLLSLLFAPLVFMGNFYTAIAGMVCWGVGMAAQESVVRAVLSSILPSTKKATGFGVFNATFGLFWFLGSFIMGWLYDLSVIWLIIFSVFMQLASVPLFVRLTINKL